jgi:hypothetical protein
MIEWSEIDHLLTVEVIVKAAGFHRLALLIKHLQGNHVGSAVLAVVCGRMRRRRKVLHFVVVIDLCIDFKNPE